MLHGRDGSVEFYQPASAVESVERVWLALDLDQFKVCKSSATVTADGLLNIAPEVWRVRHYRRAVMRGAGVYQAGLWAYLARRRQPRALQTVRTTFAGNDASTFERFTEIYGRVRHSIWWRTMLRVREKRISIAILNVTCLADLEKTQYFSSYPNQETPSLDSTLERWIELNNKVLAGSVVDTKYDTEILQSYFQKHYYYEGFGSPTNSGNFTDFLKAVFQSFDRVAEQQLLEQSQRKFLLRRLHRVLRRLVSYRAKRPANCCTVRQPLHTRPRPPSAPLAPPVL